MHERVNTTALNRVEVYQHSFEDHIIIIIIIMNRWSSITFMSSFSGWLQVRNNRARGKQDQGGSARWGWWALGAAQTHAYRWCHQVRTSFSHILLYTLLHQSSHCCNHWLFGFCAKIKPSSVFRKVTELLRTFCESKRMNTDKVQSVFVFLFPPPGCMEGNKTTLHPFKHVLYGSCLRITDRSFY